MKIKTLLDHFVRLIVGALFMFSGLIKLNDPVGMMIKLEEYFEVFANDFSELFHVFVPIALPIALFIIILEVILGVAVLINYRMEITTKVLLGLILFFTFLTFYSAFFNKVTDCGCFGDAITLTPWQSFYKDVVLTIFILHLFWYRRSYVPLISNKAGGITVAGIALVCLVIGVYAIEHLPYFDFRPYKVGDNIAANMIPEEQPIGEYTFIKDGVAVKSQQYLPEIDGYEYQSYKIINPRKSTPKITDYNIWNPDIGDFTQESFNGSKLVILTVDASTASLKSIDKIKAIIEGLSDHINIMIVTASDPSVIEAFRHEHQLAVPYFFADATVIKAMIRSNPGIMILKDGVVKGKWHYNDVPLWQEVELELAQ